jgi:hypothetical protein
MSINEFIFNQLTSLHEQVMAVDKLAEKFLNFVGGLSSLIKLVKKSLVYIVT